MISLFEKLQANHFYIKLRLIIKCIRYGTANRAFDPDIENDPTVDRAVYPDNIFSGE